MDSTITLAFFVTLVSVISPIITSIINKRYELKLRSAELKIESLSSNYERMYSTFKEFLTNSSVVILRFDSEMKPTIQEFKQFESACLECFLFLDEDERSSFQAFRILVKTKMGYADPRPKNIFSESLTTKVNTILSLAYISSGDEMFKKFNLCIDIANKKLEKISQEELQIVSLDHKENRLFDSIHSASQPEESSKRR